MSVNDVFEILNPIGERKINLNFSASPIGSVKAFENVVKRQKRLTRAANAAQLLRSVICCNHLESQTSIWHGRQIDLIKSIRQKIIILPMQVIVYFYIKLENHYIASKVWADCGESSCHL